MPFIHGKSTFADIGLQPPPRPDKAPNGERRKLRSSRAGAEPTTPVLSACSGRQSKGLSSKGA